jgi:anti-sigma-K factor RskA
MSSAEHQDYREALAAYALGALPAAEADRMRLHLESCRDCRAELDWLRGAVDALPASVTPVEPPPELKARVMEIVQAEAALLRAAGEAADRPPGEVPQHSPPRTTRIRRWLSGPRLPAAVGLAVACLAAIVVLLVSASTSTRRVPVRITAQALVGHTRASLSVRGDHAELTVSHLPVPPAGHVEELWVKRGNAAPIPAGVFVLQSGTVPVGRPVHHGDLVLVTIEPGRGTAQPTTSPFLIARV